MYRTFHQKLKPVIKWTLNEICKSYYFFSENQPKHKTTVTSQHINFRNNGFPFLVFLGGIVPQSSSQNVATFCGKKSKCKSEYCNFGDMLHPIALYYFVNSLTIATYSRLRPLPTKFLQTATKLSTTFLSIGLICAVNTFAIANLRSNKDAYNYTGNSNN